MLEFCQRIIEGFSNFGLEKQLKGLLGYGKLLRYGNLKNKNVERNAYHARSPDLRSFRGKFNNPQRLSKGLLCDVFKKL